MVRGYDDDDEDDDDGDSNAFRNGNCRRGVDAIVTGARITDDLLDG